MDGNEIGNVSLTLSLCSTMSGDAPMTRMVRPSTVKDVARLAGVSHATVSRVVNGATNVSRTTKAKVLSAISRLQYCPNAHAAELGRANGGLARKRRA